MTSPEIIAAVIALLGASSLAGLIMVRFTMTLVSLWGAFRRRALARRLIAQAISARN